MINILNKQRLYKNYINSKTKCLLDLYKIYIKLTKNRVYINFIYLNKPKEYIYILFVLYKYYINLGEDIFLLPKKSYLFKQNLYKGVYYG